MRLSGEQKRHIMAKFIAGEDLDTLAFGVGADRAVVEEIVRIGIRILVNEHEALKASIPKVTIN